MMSRYNILKKCGLKNINTPQKNPIVDNAKQFFPKCKIKYHGKILLYFYNCENIYKNL